jgi:hypothetical protein
MRRTWRKTGRSRVVSRHAVDEGQAEAASNGSRLLPVRRRQVTEFAIVLNLAETFVPNFLTPVMITTPMSAAISEYSTEVAPDSSLTNLLNADFIAQPSAQAIAISR